MIDKEEMIKLFVDFGIPHGVTFDNGSRWCEICDKTQPVESDSENGWDHKMCRECSCVWPEYAQEVVSALMNGDADDLEEYYSITIN